MMNGRRNTLFRITLILLAGMWGCGGDKTGSHMGGQHMPDAAGDVEVASDVGTGADAGATDADEQSSAFIGSSKVQAKGLATSQVCADCHSNDSSSTAMRDQAGEAIAPFDLWQSSMKANSARDPFFRAVLSAEVYRNPQLAGAIEGTCLRCHAPMAAVAAKRDGESVRFADIQTADTRGALGIDGASCVACHAMTDQGFGTDASYDGGYVLNADGELYGPHADPFTRPMQMHTSFTPVRGDHMLKSEQCATCHTLFTETVVDGQVTDNRFPEQTPYLEWRNSRFSQGDQARSCQNCHMPTRDANSQPIETRIARRPGGGDFPPVSPRQPFGQHLFIGGNFVVPGILRDERQLLRPQAPDQAFDATVGFARAQLTQHTATVAVRQVSASASGVSFEVNVHNRTGHKFPTAYPSRRAWLHVRVLGSDGSVLFESGGWNDVGQIVSGGQPLASEAPFGPTEPHRDRVTNSAQVVIYQSVMQTSGGDATVALLHAERYAKDNRLLPEGWRDDHPDAAQTRPVGVDDADFVAGGDTVHFDVPLSAPASSVEAELVYQPLGARWLAELFEVPTPEVQRFRQMFERAERTPAVVASDQQDVP